MLWAFRLSLSLLLRFYIGSIRRFAIEIEEWGTCLVFFFDFSGM
jgi:hypothetical protein